MEQLTQFFLDFAAAISPALQTLLEAALAVLAAQASAWMIQQYKHARGQLSVQQQTILDFVVKQSVQAAEQLYKDGKGAEKKAAALEFAELALAQYNITLDLDVVSAAIEAAVLDQFNKPALPNAG